ncbi:SusC/RagA family TonB-linked outer membrane protein [Pseudoflavitalea rhizosphaerae]|uniref:SusC/RagA family TonB-linked outer membrane protein n=1 Tax=Pseudoflavitalea rhizosphaerae TaxID=1884793 RepID=UPI0013DF3F5D|nr:SusC/RagA family TonB-linked outer membrane protein [Pseudoflavitalea rhizosphaerae]
MKITAILLLLGCLQVSAAAVSQTITYSGKEVSLSTIISVIEKQTGYLVFTNKKQVSQAAPVTIEARQMPVETFLKKILGDGPLEFSIEGNTISIKLKDQIPLFEKPAPPVSGRIIDVNFQPLADVSIRIRGTRKGTTSGANGRFSMDLNEDEILDISAVGFQPISLQLSGDLFRVVSPDRSGRNRQSNDEAGNNSQLLIANKQNVQIKLMRANTVLEDAVVYNGFQQIKQKYLTGSVTSLNMDSIMQPGLSTVDKMLEGRVPGLTYMQNSGQAGAAPKLRIRGTSTYLGSREPLWVVDGIIRTNPIPIPADRINDPDFVNLLGNAISGLNPYDIEQIDVLKDATAAALYGVRAANGVIVITTKRGKAGPPVVNYNVSGSYTRRPRYTDRDVYMMDSRERVDVSREIIEKKLPLRGSGLEAYELAIAEYYAGKIDFATFQQRVNRAESVNTDWLGNTMQDAFITRHTLSISGGNASTVYRASVGFNSEPGVIKKESNKLYTGTLNLQLNYRKFKAVFQIQLGREKRRYTPNEIGVMNYAYGTSRAIPLYNEDGSPYFYSTLGSQTNVSSFHDFKKMNILHEMDHTGETVENSEYTASANLRYEIASGIQLSAVLAHTGGSSDHNTWFEENTDWAYKIRSQAWHTTQQVFRPDMDLLPFGGELRQQMVRKQNYTINGQLDISRYLDYMRKHQLTAAIGGVVNSSNSSTTARTSRGYYPERGFSFADIDLAKYKNYASWLRQNGGTVITEILENSLRTFLTATYVFNDRYVFTATTSQEFSNAFGSRSNEKFLPTWALSGRWNIHEDLFKQLPWVEMAALRFSYGTQGNMLNGQTPYTIMRKGPINTYYDAYGSTIVSYPNPDLRWEKKRDYNGSLEFSILKGRIRGSLGYFYSKTTNAFLTKKVSVVNGVPGNSYVVNGGILENQGVELSMNFRIINNKSTGNKKGFMWRFDPQLGQVFNKLINNNLNSRNVLVDDAALTYQDYLSGNVPVNGKSVNTFYSYRFKTLDPQYGFPVFYGAEPDNKAALMAQYNKMTKDEVFSMVMMESGRREPVLQGGINNTFTYGNWSLDIMFSYSVGNKVRLLQIASGNYGTFRPSSQQNLRKEFVNRWRYPGDEKNTNIPALQGGQLLTSDRYAWWIDAGYVQSNRFATDYYQMYDFSDIRVVKGDHIKLQNVALTYMFPRELCMKLNIKGATVKLTGNNLFTIADKELRGQDPTQSGSSPNINLSIRPVYTFNLNLSF